MNAAAVVQQMTPEDIEAFRLITRLTGWTGLDGRREACERLASMGLCRVVDETETNWIVLRSSEMQRLQVEVHAILSAIPSTGGAGQ